MPFSNNCLLLFLWVFGMVFTLICNKCIRKSIRKFWGCEKGTDQFKLGKGTQLNEEARSVDFGKGHSASVVCSRREIYSDTSANE